MTTVVTTVATEETRTASICNDLMCYDLEEYLPQNARVLIVFLSQPM